MKQHSVIAALVAAFFLSGCAPTSVDVSQGWDSAPDERFAQEVDLQADMPEQQLSNFEQQLASHLDTAGVGANGQATHEVNVTITEYDMHSFVTRYLIGWFAGGESMISEVTVTDAGTGEVIGQSTVRTEPRGEVRATDSLTSEHAEHIVAYLQHGGQSGQE